MARCRTKYFIVALVLNGKDFWPYQRGWHLLRVAPKRGTTLQVWPDGWLVGVPVAPRNQRIYDRRLFQGEFCKEISQVFLSFTKINLGENNFLKLLILHTKTFFGKVVGGIYVFFPIIGLCNTFKASGMFSSLFTYKQLFLNQRISQKFVKFYTRLTILFCILFGHVVGY